MKNPLKIYFQEKIANLYLKDETIELILSKE